MIDRSARVLEENITYNLKMLGIKTVSSKVDTIVKTRLADSRDLEESEKVIVEAGTRLQVKDLGNDINAHLFAELAECSGDFGPEVFLFEPDWDLSEAPLKENISLKVPYYTQMDNETRWHQGTNRQCNLTSHSMLVDFLLKGELSDRAKRNGYREPESYFGAKLSAWGDTTDHNAIGRCLQNDFNITSYWSQTLSPRDVRRSHRAGIPVAAGVLYKGSGHIILIIGDLGDAGWLVHDPYGCRAGTANWYLRIGGSAGKNDIYSNASMERILWEERSSKNPETGWGRIVTAVNGVETGLPLGL